MTRRADIALATNSAIPSRSHSLAEAEAVIGAGKLKASGAKSAKSIHATVTITTPTVVTASNAGDEYCYSAYVSRCTGYYSGELKGQWSKGCRKVNK
jgi:hypothetical protein